MRVVVSALFALSAAMPASAAGVKAILPWGGPLVSSASYANREVDALDVACDKAWAALGSRAEYDAYRKALRAKMLSAIGTMPERTPLNARTVATLVRDGYRIEKVVFESMPGLYVTANLFVPDGGGRRPAVVMSCGHAMEWGKDEPGYMRACVLAARQGFVALMFDPHAQGERRWKRTAQVGSHNEMALRANLIDWSGPLLRIWDGIRAIDYVESRPEVDAERIGYMGQSGGGTMTAMIMAVEERVKVAAPSCYLTSLRRLCDTRGPQDGEQNIYGQLSIGLNHTGYVLIPDIPVAVTCKFADLFPYSGVRTLMDTVRSVERSAGIGERALLNHFSGPHGWTESSRRASVSFLAKHLMPEHAGDVVVPEDFWRFDIDPALNDGDVGIPDESERGCCEGRTTEGLPGSRSIVDIIAERALGYRARWKARGEKETAEMVRRIAKIKMPSETNRSVVDAGTNTVNGFACSSLVVQCRKTGHMLPATLFAGGGSDKPPVLVCAWKGRARGMELAAPYLREGRAVMVADVTGVGDVGQQMHLFYGAKNRPDEGLGAMCFLIGEPLVGRRATDMLVFADVLSSRCGGARPELVAEGALAIPAAHAYAADRSAWAGVDLREKPVSWTEMYEAGSSDTNVCRYADIVPRAFMEYDWADLVKCGPGASCGQVDGRAGASGDAAKKCTFDFVAASERMYGGEGGGADILAGVKWSHHAWMMSYSIKRTDPRWKTTVSGVRKSVSGNEYTTENPIDLVAALGGDEATVKLATSSWQAFAPLPDRNGGLYRLSYLYSMSHVLGEQGMMVVFCYDGKKLVKETRFDLANVDSGEFPFCKTIRVPKGADRLCFDNRINGIGKLRFWNATCTKLPPEKPVVLRQAANGWFTNTFEIPSGQSGIVCWHWRCGFDTPPEAVRGLACLLTVPAGFVLEGIGFGGLPKEPKVLPDGSREYRIVPSGVHLPKADFDAWHRLGATISTSGGAGSRGRLKMAVVGKDGVPLSDETETELVAVEPVHAPRPRRFISGIVLGGWYWQTKDGRGTEMVAKMSGDAGFNGMFQHGASKMSSEIFRRFGAMEVLQGSSQLCNGYCIGPAKGRPEADKYVFKKPGHQFAHCSACPLSVSEEREFFRTVTVPWLKQQTEGSGADALWVNWEPYYYAGKGCMCDKCRAAFAKYVGVSDEEMARDWPKELEFGGKWHDRICRFRSIEHGKLVKTLAKHANVIPGIFWGEMSCAWRPRNLAAEVQAIDYAGSLKTISPWGPYPCWDTQGSYGRRPATCLKSFCAAKDVREQVNKDYPAGARPRLQALPSGCSFGSDWVGQPEWLYLQTLGFFFNGWESSYLCGFPRGYDARYWRAMARANEIIAKYEDFVFDGVRTDSKVRLAPKRPFRKIPNVSSYLDWTREGVPVVQSVAYELNGKTMVALFNFSDEDDAEFDIYYDGRLVESGARLGASSVKVKEL